MTSKGNNAEVSQAFLLTRWLSFFSALHTGYSRALQSTSRQSGAESMTKTWYNAKYDLSFRDQELLGSIPK
jgi:hypothetical protein